jgi:hypothetical protein
VSLDRKISDLKKLIEDVKTERIRTSTKLKSLEDEKQALLIECQTLGVDPKRLAESIVEMETKLQTDLDDLQSQLDLYYATKS